MPRLADSRRIRHVGQVGGPVLGSVAEIAGDDTVQRRHRLAEREGVVDLALDLHGVAAAVRVQGDLRRAVLGGDDGADTAVGELDAGMFGPRLFRLDVGRWNRGCRAHASPASVEPCPPLPLAAPGSEDSTRGYILAAPGSEDSTRGYILAAPGSEDSTRGYIPKERYTFSLEPLVGGRNVAPGGVFGTRGGEPRVESSEPGAASSSALLLLVTSLAPAANASALREAALRISSSSSFDWPICNSLASASSWPALPVLPPLPAASPPADRDCPRWPPAPANRPSPPDAAVPPPGSESCRRHPGACPRRGHPPAWSCG